MKIDGAINRNTIRDLLRPFVLGECNLKYWKAGRRAAGTTTYAKICSTNKNLKLTMRVLNTFLSTLKTFQLTKRSSILQNVL